MKLMNLKQLKVINSKRNMKKTVLILIAVALLASCKTTKYNTRETTKSTTEVKTDICEEIKILEETKTSGNITQLLDELTTIIERIITVKLSAPDSLNNQHPIELTTTEREIKKGKTVKYDSNRNSEQVSSIAAKKTDNTKESIREETEKTDKTVVKKTTPGWAWAVVVIFSIGVLIIVFLFLKKYRII